MNDPIAARFAREIVHHQMTVLHDQGIYRHLHFADTHPDPDRRMSWNLWFDLITVPGALIFQGDGDSFVFRRLEDMFEFFRGGGYDRQPNYQYWAEKVTDRAEHVKVYDQELLAAQVRDAVAETEFDAETRARLMEAVQDKVLDELCGDHSYDLRLVDEFRWWVDPDAEYGWPIPEPDFEFVDYADWTVTDYHWWYRWACHAIVWGIARYDAGNTGPSEAHPVAEEPVATPAAALAAPAVVTVATTGGVL